MGAKTSNYQSDAQYPIELSVILVSFNTRVLLHRCLQSIQDTTHGIALEIIVIDNNSQDGSAGMVRSCFPDIRLIVNERNLGFSAACNQGLRVKKGTFVCLLNPDTLICEGAFRHMLDFMKKHTGAGALGCRLLNADKTAQSSCFKFYNLKTVFFDYCLLPKQVNKHLLAGDYIYQNLNMPTTVDWVLGACLFLRSKAIEQVGLLDKDIFMYSEEVDWCYRAKKKGWEIWFTPDAQIIHYGGQATNQQNQPAVLQLYRSRYQFFRKHYGRLSAYLLRALVLVATAWNSIFLFLRFLLRRIKGRELLKEVEIYWKIAKLPRS